MKRRGAWKKAGPSPKQHMPWPSLATSSRSRTGLMHKASPYLWQQLMPQGKWVTPALWGCAWTRHQSWRCLKCWWTCWRACRYTSSTWPAKTTLWQGGFCSNRRLRRLSLQGSLEESWGHWWFLDLSPKSTAAYVLFLVWTRWKDVSCARLFKRHRAPLRQRCNLNICIYVFTYIYIYFIFRFINCLPFVKRTQTRNRAAAHTLPGNRPWGNAVYIVIGWCWRGLLYDPIGRSNRRWTIVLRAGVAKETAGHLWKKWSFQVRGFSSSMHEVGTYTLNVCCLHQKEVAGCICVVMYVLGKLVQFVFRLWMWSCCCSACRFHPAIKSCILRGSNRLDLTKDIKPECGQRVSNCPTPLQDVSAHHGPASGGGQRSGGGRLGAPGQVPGLGNSNNI